MSLHDLDRKKAERHNLAVLAIVCIVTVTLVLLATTGPLTDMATGG